MFIINAQDEDINNLTECGFVRSSFYFLGEDNFLYGYQYELGGYYVGVFDELSPKAVSDYIIRVQM